MKIFNTLKQHAKQNKQLYLEHKKDIQKEQSELLMTYLLITMIIFSILLIISFTVPSFFSLQPVYSVAFAGVCVIYLFLKKVQDEKFAIPATYFLATIIFTLTIYLSVIKNPDSMGVSIIAVICLVPLALLDRQWRINLYIFLFLGIHSILALHYKPLTVALDDIKTETAIIFFALCVGNRMQKLRLNNHQMRKIAEAQRSTDFLTGLYNRNKLFEVLSESEAAEKDKKPSGIIMLDIDWFKKYNDTYGHQAGDKCLKEISSFFQVYGKQHDITFFRYGGEEAIALCYHCNAAQLRERASQLIHAVQELKIPFGAAETDFITISAGFVSFPEKTSLSYEKLIGKADEALYIAKAQGRNQAVELEINPDEIPAVNQ